MPLVYSLEALSCELRLCCNRYTGIRLQMVWLERTVDMVSTRRVDHLLVFVSVQ